MNQPNITEEIDLAKTQKNRLREWPRIGISLEKTLAAAGQMEDIARTLREDEHYAESYTIEEQIQSASDRLRASIRAFERAYRVKIEIFTFFSPFKDHTDFFIDFIKKPEEIK